jgi:EmrB/QacA subfamily drug resistance transporter
MPALDRKWWTLIAVCTATFMLLLDITVVNVALPDIQRSLHASFSDLQWVVDAYSLTLAAFLLTAGVAGDIYGRRKIFAIGLVVFSLASLVCGLSTTPLMLNLSRAVQGVGGAIMFATSLALIAAAFTGRDRGTAFGIYGAVIGGAVAIGPLIGGAITSGIGWRWIFFVNVPIGAIAVFITFTQIAKSEDLRVRRIDWVGFVTFSVSLFLLVFALVRGNDFGWGSGKTIGLLVGAAVLMVAFFVNERSTSDPMLDLGLFKIPAFVGLSTAAFCLAASIFAMFLYLTLYIQDNLGYGPLAAGIRFLPMTLLIFFTSFFAGRLTVRLPSRLLLGVGMLVVSGGLLLMATTHPNSTWTVLLPGFLRRQQHLPPGRHRHGHRRARRGLPEPDSGAHHGGVGQERVRRPDHPPGRCATPGRHVGRGCAPGGGLVPGRRPQRAAGRVPLGLLRHLEPSDGDRSGGRLRRCGERVRPRPPARLHRSHGAAERASGPRRAGRDPGRRRPGRACLSRSLSRGHSSGWSR